MPKHSKTSAVAKPQAGPSDQPPPDQSRSSKRMRLQHQAPSHSSSKAAGETVDNMTYSPHHLSRMPFEIIAEILQCTSSPKDVLAVARCSKFFCNTLVQTSSDYIWRNVRKSCKPLPIPDPTPNFTEASYAVFLFDYGICEICRHDVKKPWSSFAMRVRVCGKVDCRKMLKEKFTKDTNFSISWLPSFESSICLYPEQIEGQWPAIPRYYRREEYQKAVEEYQAMSSKSNEERTKWLDKKLPEGEKVEKWMSACKQVYNWYKQYRVHHKITKAQNENFAERMAAAEGWNKSDLLMTTSFERLYHYRSKLLEGITQSDFNLIRPGLDEEILKISERQKRRKAEKILYQRRADVEEHLHRLRSDSKCEPLPNLSTFRQLPVIKLVQNHTSAKQASIELKSPLIAEILRDELGRWRESARATLAVMLGQPNWKSPSSKKLHPAERVTARFKCKRCSMVARKYSEDECLDFAGVCSHECLKSIGKRKAKAEWQADQFTPDRKAIPIITKVLELCNIDPSARESLEAVKKIGPRIMCLSCDSAIVMSFQNLFGHCQRHEEMQISLLPEPASSILVHPFSPGLSAKLLSRSYEAKRLRSLREYSCRHCFQKKALPASAGSSTNDAGGQRPSSNEQKSAQSEPGPFTFDGLRSHCKQKHKILLPRDEDFFRIPTQGTEGPIKGGKKKENPQEFVLNTEMDIEVDEDTYKTS